jgi:hypothetical protein
MRFKTAYRSLPLCSSTIQHPGQICVMRFKHFDSGREKREKMMLPFTKDELRSIWNRLADGSECDVYGRIDVDDGLNPFTACTCELCHRGPQRDLPCPGLATDDNLWTLDAVVRRHILSIIEACNCNTSQAAARLKINRPGPLPGPRPSPSKIPIASPPRFVTASATPE